MPRAPRAPEGEASPESVAPEVVAPESVAALATEAPPAAEVEPAPVVEVKARVLRDCSFGKCDDVVTLDATLVESLAGTVDADPAAVAYAESLAK